MLKPNTVYFPSDGGRPNRAKVVRLALTLGWVPDRDCHIVSMSDAQLEEEEFFNMEDVLEQAECWLNSKAVEDGQIFTEHCGTWQSQTRDWWVENSWGAGV